ncbi:hypothetical protein [Clostridiisalibacter paucivorans]|uniref:hypothetical protein n=1 Tax=Clostridiisalibacter paucivorans TaxID=408753 RepID=UPI00047D273F|nr:hypothetical protein [Clostridiisalibacter paucivorans]
MDYLYNLIADCIEVRLYLLSVNCTTFLIDNRMERKAVMNYNKLKELWKKEEEQLPWDYKSMLKKYLKTDYQLLDMGTGCRRNCILC